jgi:hypothetical protein
MPRSKTVTAKGGQWITVDVIATVVGMKTMTETPVVPRL